MPYKETVLKPLAKQPTMSETPGSKVGGPNKIKRIFMFRSGVEMEASRGDLISIVTNIFTDLEHDDNETALNRHCASFLLYMALFKSRPLDTAGSAADTYAYDPSKVKLFHQMLMGDYKTVKWKSETTGTALTYGAPRAWCEMQLEVLLETRLLFTLYTVAMDQHRAMSWREMTILMPTVNAYMKEPRVLSNFKVPFMQLWSSRTLRGGLAPHVIPAAIGYICEYAMETILCNNAPVNPNREWTVAALHVVDIQQGKGRTPYAGGQTTRVSETIDYYENPYALMAQARAHEATFQDDTKIVPLPLMATVRATDARWIRTAMFAHAAKDFVQAAGPLFNPSMLTGLLLVRGGENTAETTTCEQYKFIDNEQIFEFCHATLGKKAYSADADAGDGDVAGADGAGGGGADAGASADADADVVAGDAGAAGADSDDGDSDADAGDVASADADADDGDSGGPPLLEPVDPPLDSSVGGATLSGAKQEKKWYLTIKAEFVHRTNISDCLLSFFDISTEDQELIGLGCYIHHAKVFVTTLLDNAPPPGWYAEQKGNYATTLKSKEQRVFARSVRVANWVLQLTKLEHAGHRTDTTDGPSATKVDPTSLALLHAVCVSSGGESKPQAISANAWTNIQNAVATDEAYFVDADDIELKKEKDKRGKKNKK
jgi:hypothetical protein